MRRRRALRLADEDVLRILPEELLGAMRPGSVVVNHGTGPPATPPRSPGSAPEAASTPSTPQSAGGRPAAEARTLTTLVGGAEDVLARCTPVLESFAAHVVHAGPAGAEQMAKLFNNALLMVNQAAIADVVELGLAAGRDPTILFEGLKLGSATSAALTLLGTMVTPDTVEHLSQIEALDMELFEQAMQDAGVPAQETTARGLSGAHRLPELIGRLVR